MITWEEIRDIIEEEVYIGSGAVLGVNDAAKAIVARIEAAEHSVQRTPDKCRGTTGHDFQNGTCVDCGFPESMSGRR